MAEEQLLYSNRANRKDVFQACPVFRQPWNESNDLIGEWHQNTCDHPLSAFKKERALPGWYPHPTHGWCLRGPVLTNRNVHLAFLSVEHAVLPCYPSKFLRILRLFSKKTCNQNLPAL